MFTSEFTSEDRRRLDEIINQEMDERAIRQQRPPLQQPLIPVDDQVWWTLKVNYSFTLTVGVVLLVTGWSLFTRRTDGVMIFGEKAFLVVSTTLCINGFALAVYSALGFFGIGRNRTPILSHAIMGVILSLMMITVAVKIPSTLQLLSRTEQIMMHSLKIANESRISPDVDIWAKVQSTMHCCGVVSYLDWCSEKNETNCVLPRSCFACEKPCAKPKVLKRNISKTDKFHSDGCFYPVIVYLNRILSGHSNVNYLIISLVVMNTFISTVMFFRNPRPNRHQDGIIIPKEMQQNQSPPK